MDGVFMKKCFRRIVICALTASAVWSCFLLRDRQKLRQEIIRFHVVASSDREEDQAVKLKVRDAVLESIQSDIQKVRDVSEAKEYLKQNLPKLRNLVSQTLAELNYFGDSAVTLCEEAFPVRHYDTFSLPAGVYESLRIVIGDGLGKNWWCVSFPTLCMPATTGGFQDTAVGAGFSESLAQTLSGKEQYEIRFYCLNLLGKLENIFFRQ